MAGLVCAVSSAVQASESSASLLIVPPLGGFPMLSGGNHECKGIQALNENLADPAGVPTESCHHSQGLKSATPSCSKSFTLRVTKVRSCAAQRSPMALVTGTTFAS